MGFLIGKRIRLVKFSDAHITDTYISWLNDPEVNRYMTTGRIPVTKDEISNLNKGSHGDYIFFAIMMNSEYYDFYCSGGRGEIVPKEPEEFGRHIGTCSLKWDSTNRGAEMGFMIGDKKCWGQGIGTEGTGLLLEYCQGRLGLHRMASGVTVGNIGSCKMLTNNGMELEAVIKEAVFFEGKYLDVNRYCKIFR